MAVSDHRAASLKLKNLSFSTGGLGGDGLCGAAHQQRAVRMLVPPPPPPHPSILPARALLPRSA